MSGPWEEYAAQAGPWTEYQVKTPRQPDALDNPNPTEGMSGFDKFAAGAGKAVADMGRGVGQVLGMVSQQDIDEAKARDKALMDTGAGMAGNFAGTVAALAPAAFIPGAGTVGGAAAIGGLQGALLTPGGLVDRAKAALFGAGAGAVGAKLGQVMSKAAPRGVPADQQLLLDSGVSLTPGQNLGGLAKNAEDKATSLMFTGNVIQNARKRGVEDFNRAAMARAEIPGVSAGGIGNEGVASLRQGLGQAYDDVLSKSSANGLEPQFIDQLSNLRQMVKGLPPKEAAAFDGIIEREIAGRMAPNGMINAENLQAVKSGLGNQINNFTKSNDGYQRQLGQALKQADVELRELVKRANPQNAKELEAIDAAYANFKRIQKAASGVGTNEGVFTPAQLHSASKALDKTKDKRAFSEGTALLQDLTAAGKEVLPSKIADSGTIGRGLAAGALSPKMWPLLAADAAISLPASIMYSRAGQAAINALVNKGIRPTEELVRQAMSNPAAMGVAGMSLADLAR